LAYHQITHEERYTIWALRRQEKSVAEITRTLGRHRSTIYRELRRNCGRADGFYRPLQAHGYARTRRSHSRRNFRLTGQDWDLVEALLKREDWSPEQIAGRMGLEGRLQISHETIYRHVWNDKRHGGLLHTHLRQAAKKRRKRHGTYDSRGRLAGKRPIEDRPRAADNRSRLGHWEADTVLGHGKPCVVTLVERKTGYVQIGKLTARTSEQLSRRAIQLIQRQPRPVRTITADNGTEFHSYTHIENATDARFYFATPHHAWERGTNENTNGLIRQYLPKRKSMASLTQYDCNAIAGKLNRRPRKRLGYRTPEECYNT
jgi:IS30 family transposase